MVDILPSEDGPQRERYLWANYTALLSMYCALDKALEQSFPEFKGTFANEYTTIVLAVLSHPEGYSYDEAHEQLRHDCGRAVDIVKQRISELVEGGYIESIRDLNVRRKRRYHATKKTLEAVREGAAYAATFIAKFGPIIEERLGAPVPIHHPWNYKLTYPENPFAEKTWANWDKSKSDKSGDEPNSE